MALAPFRGGGRRARWHANDPNPAPDRTISTTTRPRLVGRGPTYAKRTRLSPLAVTGGCTSRVCGASAPICTCATYGQSQVERRILPPRAPAGDRRNRPPRAGFFFPARRHLD